MLKHGQGYQTWAKDKIEFQGYFKDGKPSEKGSFYYNKNL